MITIAHEKRVPISEPFEGTRIGPFVVLSPAPYAYHRLVPQFRKTPGPDVDALKQQNWYFGEVQKQSIFAAAVQRVLEKAESWIDESWNIELLKEGGVTAAENETSVVLWGNFDSSMVLLTADAGTNALRWACDFAGRQNIDVQSATLVQVPHHGSRRNVSPSVLDRLLGPKIPSGTSEKRFGIVSAPKDDENHPRKMVLNAFLRRGTRVRSTQGKRYRLHSGTMPARQGEEMAKPFGLFGKVEAYD
jgi:hypothetical protein